ncbi:hypothetical protein [Paenibacillus humicola]|uniref:hypothetical protein n=1 Tax=Paenibacillus humicola TaxID=3110540 RepID=UPI00237B7BD6|nr:hypothetical protein [Paenibacillus humicola]
MEEHVICPWCQTEIVWDEEIGPEKNCPHCENELSGYRTVQLGIDGIDLDEDEEEEEERTDAEETDEHGEGDFADLRSFHRSQFVFEEVASRIIEEQDEAPECPVCREFMLEAGLQTVEESRFAPRTTAALGEPVVTAPFRVVWYVCPACFHTESKLAYPERERLVRLLSKATEELDLD